MSDGLKRREFLKVLGVSGAGASIAGCSTQEVERLIPYVLPPEEITPGVSTWYASVCQECSAGCGIRVKTREGRAIMVEGNPDHPVSRGGVCSRGVSALQSLYDPDRVASPMRRGTDGSFQAISWDEAIQQFVTELRGSGSPLFITGQAGPTEDFLINQFVQSVGGQRVVYDALYDSALREATRVAFGVDGLPHYDLAAADLVVSFGADFLETWGSPVAQAHQFAEMHGVDHGEKGRFVFIGSRLSLTGQNADEWIPIPAGAEAPVALAMAAHLVQGGADAGPYADLLSTYSVEAGAQAAGVDADVLTTLATAMAGGSSVALGPGLSGSHRNAAAANLAVLVLNAVAGNVGRTVRVHAGPAPAFGHGYGALMEATQRLVGGSFGSVVVSGTNPVYSTPTAAGFAQAFEGARFKVAFATTLDETSSLADLVLPASHPLESWADSAPAPGTYAVGQPAMRPVPLFDSRPVADVLLAAGAQLGQDQVADNFRDFLISANRAWLETNGAATGLTGDPDELWRELLRTGSVSYTALEPEVQTLQPSSTALGFEAASMDGSGDFTLVVYPSSRLGDGTHSNRPWLLELPDPVSKMMWHSWVEMHPSAGEALGLETGDVVRVASDSGEIEAPVWLYPGIREDTVAIAMGGGHTGYGRFANGNGVNPLDLLPDVRDDASGTLALASTRVSVAATGEWRRVATTEGSSDQDDRNVAPAVALAALGHAEEEAEGEHHGELQELQEIGGFRPVETEGRAEDYPLPGAEYGDYTRPQPRWAMSIDLDKCTGCSACVTACQAENNVPWVGENQIMMGRDMHWMRIERYYETVDASHAGTVDIRFLPMLCQHCNNAPCEPVCPVFAAYHTPDGLNGQAYNRCVGTRYCANNCPYKVRVFNWYSYADAIPEPMTWQFNPDVTVRSNGIMEKCTFCVQRIREVGNRAVLEGRSVRDGEVRPACQNSCPTGAIVFGDVKDADSAVSQLYEDERNYRVLDELINTQPAVSYMKKVTHHEVDAGDH